MPKIREAIKEGNIRLLVSVTEKDIEAMDLLEDLLDDLIKSKPEGTMKDIFELLDSTKWWAIVLASSQGFTKFIEDIQEEV